jgi:beta-glucosidase
MKIFITIAFAMTTLNAFAQKNKFMWGVASASYQVEGAYKADGKGLSNWDVYTNTNEVTKAVIGENHTANISVNQYDRKQYLKDFTLMKDLGVTHYRFSLAWSRLLPNGIGTINQKGIDHYTKFIDDLKSFGIEPCITLYHWDLPQALQVKGGWNNPKSIDWFMEYATLVFKNYGSKCKYFITFNEPNIDLQLITPMINNVIAKKESPFATTTKEYVNQAIATHHLNVANLIATDKYHSLNLGGKIGITLSLFPTIVKDSTNINDQAAAKLWDGLHNRWFLDAALKGTYPKDILDYYATNGVKIASLNSSISKLKKWKPDFIGVNFYAPALVSYDEKLPNNLDWHGNNPDTVKMFNGYVRPDYLYKLLMHLKDEYNNPTIIITENGAGFGDSDEQLLKGKVNDNLRCGYIKSHIAAALQAKKDGAKLEGYFLWSILDNFEWVSGYKSRFGITYVNFETQERIPKNSYYLYQQIITKYKKVN